MKYLQFSLPLSLLYPSLKSLTLVIMIQVSPPSLSSGFLAWLQAATFQSEDNDCASFFDPPVSSSSAPSIPSFRKESPLLTILKEISVEDEKKKTVKSNLNPFFYSSKK